MFEAKQADIEMKKRKVNSYKNWWHSIDFGDGVVSPGQASPLVHELISECIPRNLSGKTVLDIGAWDGYYTFECERRGAEVTAIDSRPMPGFEIAKSIFGSKSEMLLLDLYDLPGLKRKFDLTLFLGVIYHLKNPVGALEIIRSVTKEMIILESFYIKQPEDEPYMRFYPGTELNGDATNWWGPNLRCLLDMMVAAGFRACVAHPPYREYDTHGRVIITACC